MAKAGTVDKYANVMISRVTESAANTLTFEQMPQVTTLLEKKAYLLNRLQYELSQGSWQELKADGESIQFGISLSNNWTSPGINEPSIIDYNRHFTTVQTAVGFVDRRTGVTKDFSMFPGGGILMPTRPLYLFTVGNGLANATDVTLRMYFTVVDLSPQDYWDLVESLQAYT
jgi:hypothetical protein